MEQVFLSDIELFFSKEIYKDKNQILLVDEEFNHAVKVMRKNIGDILYVTDGIGKIYKSVIESIAKKNLTATIETTYDYKNKLEKFILSLPVLKNKERQEFALEKCIELGFTNFIYYSSEKSFKSKLNLERTNKVALSAMKQSLRAYLPKINFIGDLKNLSKFDYEIIYFDQKGKINLNNYLRESLKSDQNKILVIGSESGFSENEQKLLSDKRSLKLSENRLRSETAVIYSAVLINSFLQIDYQ